MQRDGARRRHFERAVDGPADDIRIVAARQIDDGRKPARHGDLVVVDHQEEFGLRVDRLRLREGAVDGVAIALLRLDEDGVRDVRR